MEVKISLSDMSLMINTSKHTIRYYDRIGLIEPFYDINGYRYYNFEHYYVLSTIKLLREMNVPIKEIKESLNNQDLDDLTDLLVKSKVYVDAEIKKLTRVKRLLEEKLSTAHYEKEQRNKWLIKDMDDMKYCYFGRVNFSNGIGIKEVKSKLDNEPNILYENNLMLAHPRSDLSELALGGSEIYIECDREHTFEGMDIVTLPKGKYAIYYFKGNEEQLEGKIQEAIDEIEEQGYQLGDTIYELLKPSHLISSSVSAFFAEYMMQIL